MHHTLYVRLHRAPGLVMRVWKTTITQVWHLLNRVDRWFLGLRPGTVKSHIYGRSQSINESLQTSCPDQFRSSSLNDRLKMILHSKVLSNIYLQVKLQDKDLQYHRFLGPDVREFQHDFFCRWETLLRHFVPSTFFRPMQRHTPQVFLKQQTP